MSNLSLEDLRKAAMRLYSRRDPTHNKALDFEEVRRTIKLLFKDYQDGIRHRFRETVLQHELAHTTVAEALKDFAQHQGVGTEMLRLLIVEFDRNMDATRQEIEKAARDFNGYSEDAKGDILGGLVRLQEVSCDD